MEILAGYLSKERWVYGGTENFNDEDQLVIQKMVAFNRFFKTKFSDYTNLDNIILKQKKVGKKVYFAAEKKTGKEKPVILKSIVDRMIVHEEKNNLQLAEISKIIRLF